MKNFTKQLEYIIFIILMFLQNFSIIATTEFGIAGVTCFLFVVSIKKKFYKLINRKYLIFIILLTIIIIVSCIINANFYITQILRIYMTVWLIWCSYEYIKRIFCEKGEKEKFWKIYAKIIFLFLLYGIYEFIAIRTNLPLFLNVFSNNTSYSPRGIYTYYGGWSEEYRLYSTFFEPSVFSIFLVYNFFLILGNKHINKLIRIIILSLLVFNLIFTYARTGWSIFLYFLVIYFIYNKFKYNKILDNIVVFMPFVNLLIMYVVGLTIYTDLSSINRTYSSIYYLVNSFSNIKTIMFGHGVGSILNNRDVGDMVESFAHNGYIDVIYQLGLPMFVFLISVIKRKLKRVDSHRAIAVGVCYLLCCFGVYYMIESIIVLTIMILLYCENEETESKSSKHSID